MKVLFVGQNPTPANEYSGRAFVGTKSEKRLNAWIEYLGLSEVTLINACARAGKVTARDADHTMILAAILKHVPDRIISLGTYSHGVLKRLNITHFALPHPSGRNRQLNNKAWVNAQLTLCKAWLSDESISVDNKVIVQ